MVYWTSISTSSKKEIVLTSETNIIATKSHKSVFSQFLEDFLSTIFLKLFFHELLYELIDSIDLKWCIGHQFTHPVIKKWF
jgi:hypothetical protein